MQQRCRPLGLGVEWQLMATLITFTSVRAQPPAWPTRAGLLHWQFLRCRQS